MAKSRETASRKVTEYVLSEDGQGCFSHTLLDIVKAEKVERIRRNIASGVAPKSYSITERVNEYDSQGRSVSDCAETEIFE